MLWNDLIKKMSAYQDRENLCPWELIKEAAEQIDRTYKPLALIHIGGEAIVIKATNKIQQSIILKLALAEYNEDANQCVPKIQKTKRNLFHDRFLEGCKIHADLYEKTITEETCLRVPRLTKVSEQPGLFCEMEFLDGINIIRFVKELNNLSKSLRLYRKMIKAIDYYQDFGILHRDLKANNVYITDRHKVTILDWTQAKIIGDRKLSVRGKTTLGTFPYIAPELVQGYASESTYAVDNFSLGVMLYEFIHGESVPRAKIEDLKQNKKLQAYLDALKSKIPEPLHKFFAKSTAISVDLRYQMASEMLKDFEICMGVMGISINEDDESISISVSGDFCALCDVSLRCKDYQLCDKLNKLIERGKI